MGKATRWLRSLFRSKKTSTRSIGSGSRRHQEINGSYAGGLSSRILYPESLDADKHAIAVAAATAAVAEAAFAAAHAAAEVLRLTNEGIGGGEGRAWYGGERRREVAAVIIQSAFRAYLARRALRALKALVKLQALVRGHIVRKQSAVMLHRMQAMARVQTRASATRAISSSSPHSSNRSIHFYHHSVSDARGFLGQQHHWVTDYENNDKILEVDTWKPRLDPIPSKKSIYNLYFTPTKPMSTREAEKAMSTAENTPQMRSVSSKDGNVRKQCHFTHPSRGGCSRNLFGDYASHPNYMANTESSRAKLRSDSVPRQRISFERSGSARQYRDYSDTKSERCFRC